MKETILELRRERIATSLAAALLPIVARNLSRLTDEEGLSLSTDPEDVNGDLETAMLKASEEGVRMAGFILDQLYEQAYTPLRTPPRYTCVGCGGDLGTDLSQCAITRKGRMCPKCCEARSRGDRL